MGGKILEFSADKYFYAGKEDGREEGQKETANLMAFLAKNGRTDDIVKASTDENFLKTLMIEYKGLALAK